MYMVQVSNRRPCGCLGCGCHSGWGAKGHEAACGFRRWAAADALLRLPCLLSTPLRFQRPLPPHFVCLHLFTHHFTSSFLCCWVSSMTCSTSLCVSTSVYMLILHAHFTCSFYMLIFLRTTAEIPRGDYIQYCCTYSTVVRLNSAGER